MEAAWAVHSQRNTVKPVWPYVVTWQTRRTFLCRSTSRRQHASNTTCALMPTLSTAL
jgi:hypothetical protein